MKKIKVGIIGCGSIADIAHFPSIDKYPETELVAVCDTDKKRAMQAAMKWNAKKYFTSYTEIFDKSDLDAVVIATPNALHYEQALAAAEAGVHLLIEKPLAVTNKQAWDIVESCKKAKVKLMVGCDRRFWLQNEYAKKLIGEGYIGKPVMGYASQYQHFFYYQDQLAKTDFRLKPELAGAAAIIDMGAHAIDLIIWLMGSEVKRVTGIAKRSAIPESYTPLDDAVWILMEHKNGMTSCVTVNRFSPVVTQTTGVYGTDGTIMTSSDATNPFQASPLAVYTNKDYEEDELPDIIKKYRYPEIWWAEDRVKHPIDKRWVSVYPPRESNYERMWKHFIECIIEDKQPRVSGEDGAKALEVMCGTFQSMETNGWVDLPLKNEVLMPHYAKAIKK